MMNLLLRFLAILIIVYKRITTKPGLVFAVVLGMVLSISLTMSIPLYTNAVYRRLFQMNMLATKRYSQAQNGFTLLFRYEGDADHNARWKDVENSNQYIEDRIPKLLQLPIDKESRYMRTNTFNMYSVGESDFTGGSVMPFVNLTSMGNIFDHITLIEGSIPKPSSETGEDEVEVLVHQNQVEKRGLQVGEKYGLVRTKKDQNGNRQTIKIPIRIAGVWKANDPADTFWYINPDSLESQLLLTENEFGSVVNQYLNGDVYGVTWFEKLDDSAVNYTDANRLIWQLAQVEQRVSTYLPGTRMAWSPVDSLYAYLKNSVLLTVLLYAFSVPIFGMLLAYISMTAELSIERYRNEIAVMRSRGVKIYSIIGISVVEAIILSLISLGVGIPAGLGIAWMIGRTSSFLNFSSNVSLPINITRDALTFGLVVVGVILISLIIPTISAAKQTIIGYKQERSRMLGRPWWQKAYLDVLLLIPTFYGFYLLKNQGGIAVIQENFTRNALENPLLFLVPAIGTIAFTLLCLRPIPWILGGISWIIAKTHSVGLLMATRHLSRSPRMYTVPMALLILTLSLSTFTASLAQTLDQHLVDQVYYKVGSDIKFLDTGQMVGGDNVANISSPNASGSVSSSDQQTVDPGSKNWVFLPVEEYMKLPQVVAVTRIGRFAAAANVGGADKTSSLLGIDRYTFPQVSYWRRDFSTSNLGELMNNLAQTPNGMLVPRSLAAKYKLGETQRVRISFDNKGYDLELKVVGYFDYFPTWYPDKGPLFVTNIDTIFEAIGSEVPYEVWIKTLPNADPAQISSASDAKTQAVSKFWETALKGFVFEQQRPDRQGLFGLLSIGFMGAALITVLGFLLYALFSFQQRFVEFGVLRAIGLSTSQMTSFLTWELAFLLLIGGILGTALGVGISLVFIPFLQIGAGSSAMIPPYVVDISWLAVIRVYVLFSLLFVIGLSVLVMMLRRIKIFQAVKMGETV